jgi:hypothetical protein
VQNHGHNQYIKTFDEVADLVVYLRLGDKSVAGDTILTFESGYYNEVLKGIRKNHKTCWIVTVIEKKKSRDVERCETYVCFLCMCLYTLPIKFPREQTIYNFFLCDVIHM